MKAVSIKNLIRKLSSLGLESLGNLYGNNVPKSEHIGNLCEALLGLKGEASSVALAEEILAAYNHFNNEEKKEFFKFLETNLSPDTHKVSRAIASFQERPSQQAIQALHAASESRRLELFRALNMATDGTRALITMREDIADALEDTPGLHAVDNDLLHLFRSWFNRGFLDIKRIDWETPAVVLEKLIEYESVHEIEGWDDLRRRLEMDRRCYGFFHPVMPYEPLIFVEVALTNNISTNVAELIKEDVNNDKEASYNTAIFYSINNCLDGLRGVSFGNLLIKQVVEKLQREIPGLKTFSTLSPIPRFSTWLKKELDNLEFLDKKEKTQVSAVLNLPTPKILEDAELERIMTQICSYYLVNEKSREKPACPVARFHLGNGAILGKINWRADISENGLMQSAGMMVNYIYDKTRLAKNHEAYEQNNTVVFSSEVKQLLPRKKATA
jgi:malonyl-CoA decarboxylase